MKYINSKVIKNVLYYGFMTIAIIYLLRSYVFYPKYKVESLPEEDYPVYSGKNIYEYNRSILDEDEQLIYDEIKEALLQFKTDVTFTTPRVKAQKGREIFQMVLTDHGEIFWAKMIKGYTNVITKNATNNTMSFSYAYTVDEAKEIKEQIDPKIQAIVDEANKYDSDEEKIRFVHDKLIEIGTYNGNYSKEQYSEFQSIISLYTTGETVCNGFANSFKFIMNRLGIDALSIKYVSEEEDKNHIWNMVKVNGEWKNIDITYDNARARDNNTKTDYTYFLVDNDFFYQTHPKVIKLPNE